MKSSSLYQSYNITTRHNEYAKHPDLLHTWVPGIYETTHYFSSPRLVISLSFNFLEYHSLYGQMSNIYIERTKKWRVRVMMTVNGNEKLKRGMNNTNTNGYSPKIHTQIQIRPSIYGRCLKIDYSLHLYIHIHNIHINIHIIIYILLILQEI